MNIKVYHNLPPIPDRRYDYSAIDADTYDGAPDSARRHQVGYGRTAIEAVRSLLEILDESD